MRKKGWSLLDCFPLYVKIRINAGPGIHWQYGTPTQRPTLTRPLPKGVSKPRTRVSLKNGAILIWLIGSITDHLTYDFPYLCFYLAGGSNTLPRLQEHLRLPRQQGDFWCELPSCCVLLATSTHGPLGDLFLNLISLHLTFTLNLYLEVGDSQQESNQIIHMIHTHTPLTLHLLLAHMSWYW